MKKTIQIAPFKGGQDAKQNTIKKMVISFLKSGSMQTTMPKARYIKGVLDRLVHKSRERNEANKNVLYKYLTKKKFVDYMFDTVGTALDGRVSGFVTMKKTIIQKGDNAQMARLKWVMEVKAFEDKKTKSQTTNAKQTTNDKELETEKDVKKEKSNKVDVKAPSKMVAKSTGVTAPKMRARQKVAQ